MRWNLFTYGAQVIGDYLWFSNNTFNGLFRMNIKTKGIERVAVFSDEPITRLAMHKKCLCYGKKLIFLPAYGNHIHVFDTSTDDMQTWEFDGNTERTIDAISDACIAGDKVYILPVKKGEDLKVFLPKTGTFEVIPEFKEQVSAVLINENGYLLTRAEYVNGFIHFAFYGSDIIAKWDVSSRKLYVENTGINNIFSVHIIDKERWIITTNTNVVYRINENGNVKDYKGIKDIRDGKRLYNRVIKFETTILILPAFDDLVYTVRDNELVEIAKLIPENKGINLVHSFETCIVNDNIWILPFETVGCTVIESNLTTNDSIAFECRDEKIQNEICKYRFYEQSNNGIVYENDYMSLADFLKAIF